jgi:murein L,D-transpeptidase YafK
MTLAPAYLGRGLLGLCIAVLTLAQAGAALALPLEVKDVAADRAERKRAAAEGKLPLPGTPDLARLEERLAAKGVAPDASILIRIFKAESELEVWTSRGGGAAYMLFATYPICYWSGTLGPKLKEGDRQAPEGFYTVTLPQTSHEGRWPQSLDIGYPNPFDQVHARSGSAILIHGGCASIGCFAMTNAVNIEVHKLTVRALDGGQAYVPVHVFPFRMTDENLARYETAEWRDFWRNLKEGFDLFGRSRRPPRISVCGGRYDFEETGEIDGVNPGPIAVCPGTVALMEELADINSRVAEEAVPSPEKTTTAVALAPSYLGGPRPSILTRHGPNSLQQLAPESLRPGVSPLLTRPLPCSLVLASCRKYAALRERLARKETVTVERSSTKKYRHAKHIKKKRRLRVARRY